MNESNHKYFYDIQIMNILKSMHKVPLSLVEIGSFSNLNSHEAHELAHTTIRES